MNSKIEILAPGGSFDAVKAAVVAGADAVYIGLPRFSARASAVNINLAELPEVLRYCHLRGVKVYAAVNTILRSRDTAAFLADCEYAANAGIDAFIVQDFGAARLLRGITIPQNSVRETGVSLHASTQMTIHSAEGLRFAKRQGFSRVILARELSREAIDEITAVGREIGIETEVFVHGALCMSVSGQCYMSVMVGGKSARDVRSANCGSCAGICRLPFSPGSVEYDPEYFALSLKDLSIINAIPELADMGVASVKIEGRLKRPEYVYAAVKAAVSARENVQPKSDSNLDDFPNLEDEQDNIGVLQSVFSRSGFTGGFYKNSLTDMFGTRHKEDVAAAETILPSLSAALSKAITADIQSLPLHLEITLKSGKPTALTARFEGITVTVTGAIPEAAKGSGLTSQALVSQLSKLGGTPYTAEVVVTDMDEGLFLPKSAINALRREVIEKLDTARLRDFSARRLPSQKTGFTAQRSPAQAPNEITGQASANYRGINGFVSMISEKNQLETAHEYSDFVIVPIDITESIERDEKIIVVLPRFFADTGTEEKVFSLLKTLHERGFTSLYAQNTAHVEMGLKLNMTIHGGFGLNIENPYAALEMSEYGINDITPCIESNINDLLYLGAETLTPYAYGRFPLMLTRNCPLAQERGCKGCKREKRFLTDRTGRRFPIKCSRKYGYVEILNADRMSLAARLERFPADRLLLDFYDERPEDMAKIYKAFGNNTDIPAGKWENITKGLYR